MRAYSGVSLHIRKGAFETEPVFSHPEFDMESRIVQAEFGNLVLASVYVPNGNKDYAAKIDLRAPARSPGPRAARGRARARPLRRHEHHAHRDGRASEGAQAGHHRPAARGARAVRRIARRIWSTSAASSIPTTRTCSPGGRRGETCASATSAGAWTTSSPRRRRRARAELRGAGRRRHQRPRAGDDDYLGLIDRTSFRSASAL